MDKGQAGIAWREMMIVGRPLLQLLTGEDLPTYVEIPSESWPDPTTRVAAFLREWAAALDGTGGVSLPVTGTIGETGGEHDE